MPEGSRGVGDTFYNTTSSTGSLLDGINISKLHEDKRGAVYSIDFCNSSYELIEIVQGASRGGHYHKSPSAIFVIHGKIVYREIDPNLPLSMEKELVLHQNDMISISANMAHLVTALENSLILELRKGDYEATNYPPYRRLVEDYLKKD